jgi:hypothetical protein
MNEEIEELHKRQEEIDQTYRELHIINRLMIQSCGGLFAFQRATRDYLDWHENVWMKAIEEIENQRKENLEKMLANYP